MQTAIYVRISQDRTGERAGVRRQHEDCQSLAESLGWTVVEVYEDNDRSASKGIRPNYRRMLGDIQAGRVQAVIAWAPDRLYRRLTDLEELCDIIDEHEVQVRAVQAGYVDLSTTSGQMVAGLLGVIAKHEGRQKAERWKRSVLQRRQGGVMPNVGHRLYGYTRDGEFVDDEAETIRWLADRVIAGQSLRSLCEELNRRGLPTTTGGQWQPHSLRKLLTNPRIAGHTTLRREIVSSDKERAAVDPDIWQSVHALLAARTTKRAPRVALLAGLAYCGTCNLPMQTATRTDGGYRIRRYVCVARPGRANCGTIAATAKPVEQIAEGVAREYLSKPKIRKAIAQTQAGGQQHIIAELDAQQRRLEEIRDTIASGSENVTLLDQAAGIVRERIAALEARLTATIPVKVPEDININWPTDLGERRRLVELVVERVVVAPAPVRGGAFDPSRIHVEPTDLVTGGG